ncbi:glycosyltransferase family 4 protein [Sphingomonas sp. RIT328]|uniref:glycosyltransferase family 4 protein n=1 Tax=Sphingomonas sp. RIT328 TaxID=1470591 RepID=UPI00044A4EDF|nr:glycosyltransferase family 1 protein [Sphingomonas sp. RIT328]EZP55155.1 Mannosyltransferase [Sphingomonas sp. RIT328]
MTRTDTTGDTANGRLLVNGRFLFARPTGVQRVATALLHQLGARRDELARLFPAGVGIEAPAGELAPQVAGLPVHQAGRRGGQIWEQFTLPRQARGPRQAKGQGRGDVILSLSNVGPLAATRGITMIHDAQVYTAPQSYSRPFVRWYRFLLPRLGRRNLQVLTVSHFSKQQLVDHKVAAAERITVIPNGVDHILGFASDDAAVRRLALAPRGYVVALATTQPHKNIAVLLRAFAAGAMRDLRLVLVGKTDAATMRAAYPFLPDDVIFTGMVSDGELRALLEQALCFAMPSTTEGFGLPPLEAMLLGTPAVVAPCGALPEVCGDAALYADPDDPAAWQAQIAALRDDAALAARMREAGRAQAATFTWARAGDLLVDCLRRCTGARA